MSSPEEALQSIEKHLEEHPDDASAWNTKGVLLANLEDFGAALRALNRAIRLDSKLAQAYTNRGHVLISISPENAREALDSFRTALRFSPENPAALRDKAVAHRILGEVSEEMSCLHSLVKSVKDEWQLWIRIGDLNLEIGNYKAAIKSYERTLELNEDNVPALVHLAVAYSISKQDKEAIRSAKRASKLAPEDPEVWRVLADANLRADKLKSAMRALKKAAKADPHNADVENTMGMIEHRSGRLKDAARHFKRAIIRDKKYVRAMRNLGFVSMELEEWEDAAKAWNRFTSLVKDDPNAYDAYATTLSRLEDFCSAHEAWEKARKLYKKKKNKKEASRVTELGRAARINCGRQKKAEKARKEHEKATRTFSDRRRIRRKKR